MGKATNETMRLLWHIGQPPEPDLNNPAMSATIEKKQAAKDLPVQGTSEKREILENFFQKKILGKQEHEFIPGVKTAAEAALRPKKGKVL